MRRLIFAAALVTACSANDDIPSPMVSSVTPSHAPTGAVVVISGAYFCQRPDTGQEDPTCDVTGAVHFGSAPGIPSAWSDTTIMVEVPAVTPGRADISVTAKGRTSNSIAFTAD